MDSGDGCTMSALTLNLKCTLKKVKMVNVMCIWPKNEIENMNYHYQERRGPPY